jgi:hypothetical protein
VADRRAVVPEIRLALAGARAAALAAALVAVGGFLLDGRGTSMAAGLGAGIVVVITLSALPLYRWAAYRAPRTVISVAMVGVALRLGLAAVLLAVLASYLPSSVVAAAVGCAVAVLAGLVAEAAVAARDPRLFWIDPSARERAAA